MKNKLCKIFKGAFLSAITILAMFFAQTSAYACTIWLLDQPNIPNKLILKDK